MRHYKVRIYCDEYYHIPYQDESPDTYFEFSSRLLYRELNVTFEDKIKTLDVFKIGVHIFGKHSKLSYIRICDECRVIANNYDRSKHGHDYDFERRVEGCHAIFYLKLGSRIHYLFVKFGVDSTDYGSQVFFESLIEHDNLQELCCYGIGIYDLYLMNIPVIDIDTVGPTYIKSPCQLIFGDSNAYPELAMDVRQCRVEHFPGSCARDREMIELLDITTTSEDVRSVILIAGSNDLGMGHMTFYECNEVSESILTLVDVCKKNGVVHVKIVVPWVTDNSNNRIRTYLLEKLKHPKYTMYGMTTGLLIFLPEAEEFAEDDIHLSSEGIQHFKKMIHARK